MGRKKPMCSCRHLGHCLFHGNPTTRTLTDLSGEPLFRSLEPGESTVEQAGDLCESDGNGNVVAVRRAIDLDRVMRHARKMQGCRCKAEKWLWRRSHPAPEEDTP